jgi:ABC-type antimicrobial peptide transport system permease subunit
MFKNHFKIAVRNLLKSKSFSFVNILGLTIGMAAAMLILLWIQNELEHDRFYPKINRIYKMYNRDKFNGEMWAWSSTPKIMAPTIKKDYPEVEDATRFSQQSFLLTVGDKKLNEQAAFVDSSFLSMFDMPLIKGNSASLNGNYTIVITEKLAKNLFGNEDAMGKIIKIDSVDNFTVTGILKNSNNTSFYYDFLLPWSYKIKIKGDDQYWGNNSVQTYVLLKENASQSAFDDKVKNITIDHTKNGEKSATQVFSYPLSKVWLYGKNENGKLVDGRIVTVRLFGIIAAFILLIACINFMNLSTARSEKRAKEVGIRKVVGANKNSLIIQFIGESILVAFIAGILALVLVQLCLPSFNTLVNKQLFIEYSSFFFWKQLLLFIIITGLLAGSYPAFFLSSFEPIKVLKGSFRAAHAAVNPRKVLVVLQFTFAIILIISTIIIGRQIKYAQERDLGYTQNNLIYVFLEGDIDKNYNIIKQSLLNSGAAISITKSGNPITQRWSDSWGFSWEGCTEEDKKIDFIRMSSDGDFTKTLGTTIVEGRDIDPKNYPADSTSVLLNETAVKKMRLKHPVGMVINADDRKWTVIGIVKDFILESPYDPINPTMVMGPKSWFNVMHIRLNPAKSIPENIKLAEQVFKQYNPQYPFNYLFVDDDYAKKFADTKRTATLAALFAGLTIVISCLGLFALAAFMAQNRIKEIGVRKVLGASVTSITTLLSKDFLKLVLIAFVIASPIAWYAMNKWLESYTYKISVEWWVFAATGLISVIIAFVTVSYQAIRAANANPVKSLKTE